MPELLITLVILGLIATFTIPKVLASQQSGQYKSKAKEVAGMISGAYQAYIQQNGQSASMAPVHLTPFMNYVLYDTTTPIDDWYTGGTWGCDAGHPCLLLHNGGRLLFDPATFLTLDPTSSISFQFDPDGVYGGTTNGPGKAVNFALYPTGRLVNKGAYLPNSYYAGSPDPADPAKDPPWFSWN